MSKKMRELVKEFQEKYCTKCDSYFFCGGEVVPCKHFEKFRKEKENKI